MTEYEAPEELQGQVIACSQCGKEFDVSEDSELLAETDESEIFLTPKESALALVLALCLISGHSRGPLPVTVMGWSPLVRATIVNGTDAREAHLKIGWAVFENASVWYSSPVCKDKRWRWLARDSQTDKQKELYAYYAVAKPVPKTSPFAVIATEHLAKRQSAAAATPRLVVGGPGDSAAPEAGNRISYIVADPPVGYDQRTERLDFLVYTGLNASSPAVYQRDTLIRTLWFLTGPEVQARTFSLLLDSYKPIAFTVPEMLPLESEFVQTPARDATLARPSPSQAERGRAH